MNFVALGICSIVPLLVGYVWYHPKVMGETLTKLSGEDGNKSHPPYVYLLTIVASFMIAMLLSAMLGSHAPEEQTFDHGLFHGALAAVFMGIPTFSVISIFENKSAKYILIHAAYWLISYTIMGGVIGYF